MTGGAFVIRREIAGWRYGTRVEKSARMDNREYGARERAVDDGIESLADGELVALVLGTGHAEEPVGVLAAALLEEHGGVRGLARAGLGGLAARRGIGRVKGARLAAALELGRRASFAAASMNAVAFPQSRSVDAWARPRLAAMDHEELWLLALDGRSALRAARRVAAGGLHGMNVALRDPLRVALREAASSFVLVHNHPSGDPTPSPEDIDFTRHLAEVAAEIGTPIVDHVVVAREGYASMFELGLMTSIDARGSRPGMAEAQVAAAESATARGRHARKARGRAGELPRERRRSSV
jgi:DNA repair protein RadC